MLNFPQDGAALSAKALSNDDLTTIICATEHLPADRAGTRLHGLPGLSVLLGPDGPVGRTAATTLGPGCRPVRAVLFDKSLANNWSLPWHQDRTIVVKARMDAPGYGPWSVKAGLQHVAPPFHVLERMVTLRVHIDPVHEENAPLKIACGSHKLGRIAVADVDAVAARCPTYICTAEPGDVWLYSTPILHGSDAARRPSRRRVLQVDYAAFDLDHGLEWLGV